MLLLEDSPLFSLNLPLNPPHNQRHYKNDLCLTQRPTLLNSMPLLDTTSTTCGGGMLGDKHRMASHRYLFAAISGKIRSNSGIILKMKGRSIDTADIPIQIKYGGSLMGTI